MGALLDVNMLIALLDEDHPHHAVAMNWLRANSRLGWATCPITQGGCLRILSQPRYPNPFGIVGAIEQLLRLTSTSEHEFIPDDVNLLDAGVVDFSRLSGHRQLTDVYLLALAVRHDLRFVTLDRGVQLAVVGGASESHLAVI